MKKTVLAMTTALVASGYFNTNAGSKLYVCATPQPNDLNAIAFAGLTWVLIGGVGNDVLAVPETFTSPPRISEPKAVVCDLVLLPPVKVVLPVNA